MDILLKLFTLLGGLAFFLYGMNVMSGGLKKLAGGSLERSLKQVTSNRFYAMVLGAVITAAIQSSSAVTVMLVGLVNSGIMGFQQTIGVILGSAIGTTATNWIVCLSGMGGSGVLALLKPESFTPVLALVGVAMMLVSKKPRRQDVGRILVGFAVLMTGLEFMGDSVARLKDSDSFRQILLLFRNPLLGLLVGTVFTGVIQSSSAAVTIIQTLSATGEVSFGMAVPLILGANIGTCVTALVSAIGVTREAKKVSVMHVAMKVIGAALCMAVFYGLHGILDFNFLDNPVNLVTVAAIHTAFNVVNTAILLPFQKQLVKLADLLTPRQKGRQAFLDERLLATASVAVSEAAGMTVKMADLAKETVQSAMELCVRYDDKKAEDILKNEGQLDRYEDKLGTFLVKLSPRSLSVGDARQVSRMLHAIGDFERLGDHAVNLLHSAREIHEKQIAFSEDAVRELGVLQEALTEILELTIRAYREEDVEGAKGVEPLEQVIDQLIGHIKNAHIHRLQSGKCTIQTGFVLSDLLNNCERVSDHCSNIAVALIETSAGGFDTHKYLSTVKETDSRFAALYRQYAEKYRL